MSFDSPFLTGAYIRLETLEPHHADGLAAACAGDPALYKWSSVPRTHDAAAAYIENAIAARDAGTAVPFAIVRIADSLVVGSTRLFNLERWNWPASHQRSDRIAPDICEIGHTWLGHAAIRTAANTEAKLLLLTQAFEEWQVLGVCLHADARNLRSRTAIERIGGKFDGILRAHRMAADATPRDSARYSIIASEWPEAKRRLTERLSAR